MTAYIHAMGIPASGKSTWAQSWVAEDPLNRVRVNKDALRALANNSQWSNDYEEVITATQLSMIEHALSAGKSEMAVKQGKYGELYGDDGGHLKAVLSFGEDERKCWTSIGLINPKALDRLVIQ